MCSWCNGYSHTPWGITPEMQVLVPGFSDALVFLMMVDNTGPQNLTQVLQGWANVRTQFPNATIFASSLETFAARLETVKHTLPVYSGEIGDSWIYGAPSDPQKVRSVHTRTPHSLPRSDAHLQGAKSAARCSPRR